MRESRPRTPHVVALVVGALLTSVLPTSVAVGQTGSPDGAGSALPSLAVPSAEELSSNASMDVRDAPPDPPQTADAQAFLDQMTATIDALPADVWELDAVATSLGSDPASAFAFVRDSIGFDPYVGVLRGAGGTLAARAGNAYDRAMLLASLLQRLGATTRFAFAELDEDTAAAVLARAFIPPMVPLPDGAVQSVGPDMARSIDVRARRDDARLRQAVGDRLIGEVPEADQAPTLSDVARHAWVQLSDGERWIDLDPTMADSAPGDVVAPASRTLDTIPDEDRQWVAIRVVAETSVDGAVSSSLVMNERLDAATAAGSQVVLAFTPDQGGGGLLGSVGAPTSYSPLLIVNGETRAGSSFAISGDDGGGFGLGGGSVVDLAGLRVEVESGVPGREPRIRERVLLDRIPADVRATGSVSPEQLRPMALGDAGPLVLGDLHHILVSNGGANPRDIAVELVTSTVFALNELDDQNATASVSLNRLMWPLTAADDAMALVSERFIVAGLDAADDARVFVGQPRVVIVSMGSDPSRPDAFGYWSDLALDDIDVVRLEAPDPAADAQLRRWYGVLQTGLETEQVLALAAMVDPTDRAPVGVSLRMTEPLTVIAPDDRGSVPPTTAQTLIHALEDGLIVVAPGDVAESLVWWTIDRSDGTTRSILEPGLAAGHVPFPSNPMPGYVRMGQSVFVEQNYMREYASQVERRAGLERQIVENMVGIASIGMTSGQYAALAALFRAVGYAILAGRFIR